MITLSDIMNVDMAALGTIPDAELEGALAKGKQILLARQRAQKAAGLKAPIWNDFSPYRLKTKGLSRTDAENQFKAIYAKLNAQTTTVKGYKAWLSHQAGIFNKQQRGNAKAFTGKQIGRLWGMYDKFQQLHPALVDKFGSDVIYKEIVKAYSEHPRITIDKLDDALKKFVEEADTVSYTDEQWNNM